jgi:hypothetical protein
MEVPQYTIAASFTGEGTVIPVGDTVVNALSEQSYSFSAAAGYRIGSVVVDGTNIGTPNGHTFYNIGADHSLVVNFIPDEFTVTASAGAGGSVDPAGVTTVPRGGGLIYTFTPDAGYKASRVRVGGGWIDDWSEGVASYTVSDVQFDQMIWVTFERIAYAVTAISGPGGSISPVGTISHVQGTSPSYQITPDAGYHVVDVVDNGHSFGPVTSHTIDNISETHTVSASFAQNDTYTINATKTGSGSIAPAVTSVVGGATQSYSFSPDPGYRIGSVIVDGTNIGTPTGHTFYNISNGHKLVVNFVADTVTITSSAGAGGSISPAGATMVPKGGGQAYTFTPNAGYKVLNVKVGGASIGTPNSYTFTNVQYDQGISVTFTKITHTVTSEVTTTGGAISPVGARPYTQGSSATYYIMPTSGYVIADVMVDGVPVGAVKKYVFSAISAPHTISASFALE